MVVWMTDCSIGHPKATEVAARPQASPRRPEHARRTRESRRTDDSPCSMLVMTRSTAQGRVASSCAPAARRRSTSPGHEATSGRLWISVTEWSRKQTDVLESVDSTDGVDGRRGR